MQQESAQVDPGSPASADRSVKQAQLRRFLENEAEADALLGILSSYVRKAGLATGAEIQDVAYAVLGDTLVEALPRVDKFDPQRSPRAWLLGFAINIIRRRRKNAQHLEHEVSVRQALGSTASDLSDDEVWDRFARRQSDDPSVDVLAEAGVAEILALVGPDDQQVLQLALLHNLDGEELGQALSIKSTTARVRLHRALDRLRKAWSTHIEGREQ